jgi:putative RecB family exonuclease
VPFELPRSLSPSKVTSFRDCALAFRFTAIEHLPEAPTIWTVKGTLVHRALERLFWHHARGDRTPASAAAELGHAWHELQADPEYTALSLSPDAADALRSEAETLVRNEFELEDPNEINPVGIELTLEARVGDMRLRGIIDRLDLTSDGELVVIDYKTGRAPAPAYERSKLIGVHIYALLCEEVLGRRPVQVKLLHLKEPTTIVAEPSEQALRGHRQKAARRLVRHRAGLPRRGLPTPHLPAVQLLPLPGVLPRLRWRPLPGGPGPRRRLHARCSMTVREAGDADGPPGVTPGLAKVVGAVDDRVDTWFEPLRGKPGFDGAAKVITGLGDRGLMWAATTAWRARRPGPSRARAVRALAVAGVESSLVNAGLKAVIGRSRPDRSAYA